MKPIELVDALLMKNRTIVSRDWEECIDVLGQEIPLKVHKYPTGTEHGSWNIPQEWNVVKAELANRAGDVLGSYADHPLFLAPYSCSFKGWISREELLAHVRTAPNAVDAYSYEHRLAYDYSRRLKEWIITLPQKVAERLDEPEYFVDIQVETRRGNMLVAESNLTGEEPTTLAFLAHLCHPGQANDGLAGVAVGIEAMQRIAQEFPTRRYSYQLLIMPETIGSAVYLANHSERIDTYLGAVFCETPGVLGPLNFVHTRRGNVYLDRVLKAALNGKKVAFSECGFAESLGNDELVFDSPGVGIPGAALVRFPFAGYHTSEDSVEHTHAVQMDEIVEILLEAVRIIEQDFIPRPQQRVPFYLTRFGLYADSVHNRPNYELNTAILGLLWEEISVVDIALKLGASIDVVTAYVQRFVDSGLVVGESLSPEYCRREM